MTAPYSVSVEFTGSGVQSLTVTPNVLSVTQQEFAHDMVSMQWWGGNPDSNSLESGVPISVTFGRPYSRRAFNGYVNHRGRVNNSLSSAAELVDRNATNVVCVGASWPMKQAGVSTWSDTTISQVAQEIANLFGFSTDIAPHPTVWSSLQMSGMSYWQFLVKWAKRVGYTFYVSGTRLVFKPRPTDPTQLSSLSAVYDYKADPSGFPIFTPVLGSASPTGGRLAARQLASIDPRTNQPIFSQVIGSPTSSFLGSQVQQPVFAEVCHDSVSSQQESNGKTLGAGLTNQMYIMATATAAGNPLVAQGSFVFVKNAPGGQNGLWYAQKVVHTLDTKTYSMDMTLGRDSIGTTTAIAVSQQLQVSDSSVFRSGAWVSA